MVDGAVVVNVEVVDKNDEVVDDTNLAVVEGNVVMVVVSFWVVVILVVDRVVNLVEREVVVSLAEEGGIVEVKNGVDVLMFGWVIASLSFNITKITRI